MCSVCSAHTPAAEAASLEWRVGRLHCEAACKCPRRNASDALSCTCALRLHMNSAHRACWRTPIDGRTGRCPSAIAFRSLQRRLRLCVYAHRCASRRAQITAPIDRGELCLFPRDAHHVVRMSACLSACVLVGVLEHACMGRVMVIAPCASQLFSSGHLSVSRFCLQLQSGLCDQAQRTRSVWCE